jgi:hypothetical protein
MNFRSDKAAVDKMREIALRSNHRLYVSMNEPTWIEWGFFSRSRVHSFKLCGVEGSGLCDDIFAILMSVPCVEEIDLQSIRVSTKIVLPATTVLLSVSDVPTTSLVDSFDMLSALREVRLTSDYRQPIVDGKQLSCLPSLERLYARGFVIAEGWVESVVGVRSLKNLDLCDCQIQSLNESQIATNSNLEILSLHTIHTTSNSKVVLAPFLSWSKLRELSLCYSLDDTVDPRNTSLMELDEMLVKLTNKLELVQLTLSPEECTACQNIGN